MTSSERVMQSEYMFWAKRNAAAPYNLATSGVENFPLAGLDVTLKDIELSGPSAYGYVPLLEEISRRFGVAADSVMLAPGTSMANHFAMAVTLRPGDEVLIEAPSYELLTETAVYLGARVRRFSRAFEQAYAVDAGAVEQAMTDRTRLIVLTNLHNPSSSLTDTETLLRIGRLANDARAHVLVDEVYLEALYDCRPPTAYLLGPQFLVTSSLTKAYGLSGLRCGWVLADPTLVERMRRLNDLFEVIPAHPAERLSMVALGQLSRIADRAKSYLEPNRRLWNEFAARCDRVRSLSFTHGTVTFPRMLSGRVDELCELLRAKYDTSVVPGRFFGEPNHFRVSIGGNPEMFAEGLRRLECALQELESS